MDQSLLTEATNAINNLDKKDLIELKAFASPPPLIKLVAEAVMSLFGMKSKNPWKDFQKLAANPVGFISQLKNYDKDNVSAQTLK